MSVAAFDDKEAVPERLLSVLERAARWLAERGIGNARREAEWIFADTLGLSRLELYTRFDMPLDGEELARLRARVQRRGRREPLAYILGWQPFAGLQLMVTPAVLVPRPETEELVARALGELPRTARRALDVGTGSGAIALALKRARPELAVVATEISAEALAVARANGARLALDIDWRCCDLATAVAEPCDLVVANLPYIADDERALCDPELAYEPELALFPGGDGLGPIRRLLADAQRLLAPDGVLWLEHGFRQGAAVAAEAAAHGLRALPHRDAAGTWRYAEVRRA